MSKRKEPPEITKQDIEHEHPQIKRSEYTDVMSARKLMTVTIPPTGGDVSGVLEAIHQLSTDDETHLNSWARLKAAIDYDHFEKLEPFRPQLQLHLGPVQPPEMFSEMDFKRRAYLSLKHVLLTLEGMPDDQQQLILDHIAPSLFAAGRAFTEAQMRKENLSNVDIARRVLAGAAKGPAISKGTTKDTTRDVLARMSHYISIGHNKSKAAYLTYREDKLGGSVAANRKLFWRYGKKDGT